MYVIRHTNGSLCTCGLELINLYTAGRLNLNVGVITHHSMAGVGVARGPFWHLNHY